MRIKKYLILFGCALVAIVLYLWVDAGIKMREREDRLRNEAELKGYEYWPKPSQRPGAASPEP